MDLSPGNRIISPRLLKPQSVGDSLLVQWRLWSGFPQTCPPSFPHGGVGRGGRRGRWQGGGTQEAGGEAPSPPQVRRRALCLVLSVATLLARGSSLWGKSLLFFCSLTNFLQIGLSVFKIFITTIKESGGFRPSICSSNYLCMPSSIYYAFQGHL